MKWWIKKNKGMNGRNPLKKMVVDIIKETPYVLKDFFEDGQHFGNIIFTLNHDKLLLRFIQDRDSSWSEFGFEDYVEDWLDFETALKVLGINVGCFPRDLIEVLKFTINIEIENHNKFSVLKDKNVFNDIKRNIFLIQKRNSAFWNGEG